MYTEFKEFYREFKPFFFGFVFIGLLLAYGVFVYSVIEGWSLLESLYQVIITLSTVGFGEEHEMSRLGKIHTSILIFLGVGGFAYLLGSFTEALIEGRIQMFWGRKKMERQIQSKHNHYIVCGFGRIGSVVARELLQEGEDIVVIENHPDLVQSLEQQQYYFVEGDATYDTVLEKAGVKRANVIITTLNTDAKNLYVTLSAKQMNPDIFVVARAETEDSLQKLEYAGADRVLTPYLLGGKRMAQMVLRPTVTNFLEMAMHGPSIELQMEELELTAGSSLQEKTLIDSRLRPEFNLIIIGIKKENGEMIYNPKPDEVLHKGDTLIVVGRREDLEEVKKLL